MNVVERIQQFNKHLLPQEVEMKYALISANPFSFFRGTCHLYYEDLQKSNDLVYSPKVWICGTRDDVPDAGLLALRPCVAGAVCGSRGAAGRGRHRSSSRSRTAAGCDRKG